LKILILSFYYEPDLSAGSFRSTSLVRAMLDQLSGDSHIEVITTLPNRYSSFNREALELESHPKLTVNRISLSTHNSGMLDQSRAFLGYAAEVVRLSKGKEYDLVFATSSRLMTAILGAYVSKRRKSKLYLDIRDIFVDTIRDVLPKKARWFISPVFSILEGWVIRSAVGINLVSAGFLPYFRERYSKKKFFIFTNGIDDEFIGHQASENLISKSNLLNIVYAGNIGEGQGLHSIIPELARRFSDRMHFKIIGDGGRRSQLASAVKSLGCSNVEILPPVNRNELIEIYQKADVLFLHLNDYAAFRKVLPSKIFEYGALGKPIWAGVAGYAAEFIKENLNNSAVFMPCDVEEAHKSFDNLELATRPRDDFVEKFSRAKIMKNLAANIISFADKDDCTI